MEIEIAIVLQPTPNSFVVFAVALLSEVWEGDGLVDVMANEVNVGRLLRNYDKVVNS
jgi:hypothetical protein